MDILKIQRHQKINAETKNYKKKQN